MQRKSLNVFRIDERVFLFMIALMFISSLILAFRYKNAAPCAPVSIEIAAASFTDGTLISFAAGSSNGTEYNWDFGDGTKLTNTTASIRHAFKAPGSYLVAVLVNGHCEAIKTVRILPAPVVINASLIPDFIAPESTELNQPVTFTDTTADAESWEWLFDEGESVYDRNRQTSYTFTTPGPHTIILKINGRSDRVSSKQIFVKPATPLIDRRFDQPLPPRRNTHVLPDLKDAPTVNRPAKDTTAAIVPTVKPQPVNAPPIEADEMIIILQGIVTGEKKPADVLPYFCGEPDIMVTYNGTRMKFSQMCTQLRKFGRLNRITVPGVRLVKSNATNCLKGMDVTVSRRTRFDRLLNRQD